MRAKSALLILLPLTFAFLAFQNCSSSIQSSKNGEASSKIMQSNGNGDGYAGKLDGLYVNADVTSSCPGGSQEKSVVKVENGKAYLVKENCVPIVPKDITASVDLREYDSEALVLNKALFERVENGKAKVFSELMCRGSQATPEGLIAYADVFMTATGEMETFMGSEPMPAYRGRVNTGLYTDSQQLVSSRSVAILHALRNQTSPTVTNFMIIPERTAAVAPPPPAPGEGYVSPNAPYMLRVDQNVGMLTFGSPELQHMLQIQGMECFRH